MSTSEPLRYQPSRSAVYYTPPARVHWSRAATGFFFAAIGAIVGGVIYAKIQPRLENLFVRGGAAATAAVAAGLLAMSATMYGKVRSPVIASFVGATLALVSLYAMWLVWVHDVLIRFGYVATYAPLIRHPDVFVRVIRELNLSGTWSYNRVVARGFGLAVFWAGEASMILLCGVFFPIKAVVSADEIECRECRGPCRLVRPILRFGIGGQDDLVAAIENRDFARLVNYPAPQRDNEPQLSLRLFACSRCGQTNVLTVNRITWELISTGTKMQIRPVVNQMMVTHEEAEELRALLPQVAARQQIIPDDATQSTNSDGNADVDGVPAE